MDQNAQSLRPRVTPRVAVNEPERKNQLMDDSATVSVTAVSQNALQQLSVDATGILPENAPLANPYVPFQREGAKQYAPEQGLIRGTLFPGLDLPFMGMVNTQQKDTPFAELQALDFAVTELGMYLDTHGEDRAALQLFEKYAKLYEDGKKEYEKRYGPLQQSSAGGVESFNWIKDPWPWDYGLDTDGKKEG